MNLWFIGVGCRIMSFLRAQRRPGSVVAGGIAVALPTVATAKELDWPPDWWTSYWGRGAFVALTALAGAGTFFVALGFKKMLGRDTQMKTLAEAADGWAKLVEQKTSLQRGEFNVNIWLVKGMKGFRRLVRGPSIGEKHHRTPIEWTKGKGIIGQAWRRRKTLSADLDRLRTEYPTQEKWCARKREERFHLSWDEFGETDRYRAVVAVPLRMHRFARHRVRGVLAIDSLLPGKGAELEAVEKTAEFSAIRRICESAFAEDE